MAYKKQVQAKNGVFLHDGPTESQKILRSEPLDDEEISNAPTKEEIEEEENRALTDTELLAKYELPDPEQLKRRLI